MLTIRTFTEADIPLGMRLKEEAGWNQLEADWQRALALEPTGCFVGLWENRPVGTLTTCVFDDVAWIAMVLTDGKYRGRGIASGLMRHALDYLQSRAVRTVRLDATNLGRPVYEKLGFAVDFELSRVRGAPDFDASPDVGLVEPLRPEHCRAAWKLDRRATHTERSRLLMRIYDERPHAARFIGGPVASRAFALGRLGSRAAQIGPIIAADEHAGAAILADALQRTAGRDVYVDVPNSNVGAVTLCRRRGLEIERSFFRMTYGVPLKEVEQEVWASSGPEFG